MFVRITTSGVGANIALIGSVIIELFLPFREQKEEGNREKQVTPLFLSYLPLKWQSNNKRGIL